MELPWKIDFDPMLKPNTIILGAGGTEYMIKSVSIKDGVATVDCAIWLNQPLELGKPEVWIPGNKIKIR